MSRSLLLVAVVGLAACTSPESLRERGGGPGADKGNRGAVVFMHEGSKPYAGTPHLTPTPPPPLESARQAHRLSTNGNASESGSESASGTTAGEASGGARGSTSGITNGSAKAE